MLKSKGAMIGVAVALVATALTFAGMAVSTTSGAGTDQNNGEDGIVYDIPAPTTDTTTPPQSEVEQPIGGTDPTGDQAGAGAGAEGLPDTGYGVTGSDNGSENIVVLLGLAGAALLAAGGAAATARKR